MNGGSAEGRIYRSDLVITCEDGSGGRRIKAAIMLARNSIPKEEHDRLYEAVRLINPEYFSDVMDSSMESANNNLSLVLNYFARYGEKARIS